MTTYTTIPNADVDTDSPITTSLVTALRDNPTAITEGASGAPTIARGAITPGVGHRWFYDYGDGSDGAITHSATASIAPGLYQCTTFQIDATYAITLSAMGPLIICATTSITINGTLDVDGQGARGGDANAEGGQPGMIGGSGGGAGSGGGSGGDTFMVAGGVASGAGAAPSTQTINLITAQPPLFHVRRAYDATQNRYNGWTEGDCAVGGGGGGGITAQSDNGGNGGGVVVLIAPVITVGSSGVITADGGAGDASYGGGGGGGAIILATPAGGLTEAGGSSVAASAGGATTFGKAGGAGFVERITLT